MKQPTLLLIVAAFCLVGSVAHAGSSEHQRLADELQDRFQIVVEDAPRWSEADLRSLVRGAEALPQTAWRVLDGPFRVRYVEKPCAFGMGRYNRSCPTFEGRRKKTFFIYDSPPVVGEGPVETLAVLTAEEQRDIQVRRAVIHMAMVHIDEMFGWSRTEDWRAINSWRRRGPALNLDTWGYSRPLGMHSAHLDLVTFAEEYFWRPEDLLLEGAAEDPEVRARLEALDPNLSVTCQQFSKRRVLTARLQELEPRWQEAPRFLPHMEEGEPQCPAFERWSRPDLLDGFDILLAAPTSNQPESLYGHLLLHVRYKSDGRVRGEGFEPVYQFGAVTDTDVSPVVYFTRGLLGGFPSLLELNTFRGIDRLFLQYQQRSLRRFSLQLTEEQGRRFLERIWEGERRILYPYVFLPHNCASFLVDLLAPAVDPGLPKNLGRIVMPTDVLDVLAEHTNGELGPLLIKRPDTLRSNREVAEEAILARRALLRELNNGADPALRHKLAAILDGLDSLEPAARQEIYEEAGAVFDALLRERPEQASRVIDFLYHSVLVERYFMELAHYARRAVYLNAGGEFTHMSTADQLEQRRQMYRHEDIEARVASYNERTQQGEAMVQVGAEREFTETEQAILDNEANTRRTYMTALQVQASLVDRHLPDWNGVAYLDARAQAYYEEMSRIDELSLKSSGRNRLTVGGGYDPFIGEPTLNLSFSTMEDRLGELRQRGYRGDLESRVFSLDATIPFDPQGWREMQIDAVLFRYQSLERTYGPIRESVFDALGWSVDLRIVHDGRRHLWAGLEFTPSLLVPLWTGRDNVHHLVFDLGIALRHDIHSEQDALFGATAGLFGQLHLYGNYANVLRFGLRTNQYLGFGPSWRFDVAAHLESRHLLFHVGQRALIAIPFAEALWTTRDYRPEPDPQGFHSVRGGLKLELPF